VQAQPTGMQKELRRTRFLILFWVLIAAVAVTAATYAWFTFSPYTNVEPMSSTVSDGEVSLLISNSESGTFDVSCALTPQSDPDTLKPLSTADLDRFYEATAQDQSGISLLYQEVTDQLDQYVIHGTVYLQSKNGSCDVYLYQSGLDFGSDAQALASLRLGLKLTTQSGTSTYLFKLDNMGNTASASATRTVLTQGTVVSSVSADGTASYVSDPSTDLNDYFAVENGSDDQKPTAGTTRLGVLLTDEIASAEYWLYLEGCDDNCINEVQNRELSLQLAFAGVKSGDSE
jgi:hypothetical protein